MQGYKLLGRTEAVSWERPVLRFVIERHGGAAFGSTRAELQRWEVDTIDEQLGRHRRPQQRQLRPMASRLDVRCPLARRIVAAIVEEPTRRRSGGPGPRLRCASWWAGCRHRRRKRRRPDPCRAPATLPGRPRRGGVRGARLDRAASTRSSGPAGAVLQGPHPSPTRATPAVEPGLGAGGAASFFPYPRARCATASGRG